SFLSTPILRFLNILQYGFNINVKPICPHLTLSIFNHHTAILIFSYLSCNNCIMIIGVLKEPSPETRVSLLPEHISTLKKWNVEVFIESGAGTRAFANDEKYTEAGGIIKSRIEVIQNSDIILLINTPQQTDIENLQSK